VLYAAQRFPPAVTALFGGALVDRHRKLALLTWGKAVGGVLLLCVPVAAYFGWLSPPLLCVVGLLLAAVNDISSTAGISYLPSLARGDQLAAANSKMGALFSFTDAAGSYVASGLIALLGTSRAIVASYFISARCYDRLAPPGPSGPLWRPGLGDGPDRRACVLCRVAQLGNSHAERHRGSRGLGRQLSQSRMDSQPVHLWSVRSLSLPGRRRRPRPRTSCTSDS